MSTPPRPRRYTARIGNVYFLSRIGLSLRWATRSLAPEELPAEVRQLLARLAEVEAEELATHAAARRRAHDSATV